MLVIQPYGTWIPVETLPVSGSLRKTYIHSLREGVRRRWHGTRFERGGEDGVWVKKRNPGGGNKKYRVEFSLRIVRTMNIAGIVAHQVPVAHFVIDFPFKLFKRIGS